MDPALSQAFATLIGAITTSILIIVAFYFGPSARAKRERDAELADLRQQVEVNKQQIEINRQRKVIDEHDQPKE